MFRSSKRKKQPQTTDSIATPKAPANTSAGVACRRSMTERRVSELATSFPLVDGSGAKINNDRRCQPDRRYDVEIQWLRG